LADGSGIPVNIFKQINLIGEMLKASCSILGAYGKASKSGKTVHLRALDWEEHAPMNRWPSITVYHSTEAGSIPFANIAWPGYIGTLTGYNA
jgi:isopenicillin-N N-acyltransferase like protein